MKLTTLCSLAALLHAQQSASAAKLTFINSCDHQIALYDNANEVSMQPGASREVDVGNGFRGMFRAGKNPQATLAEFTVDGGKLWYDISIIPTSSTKGPEYCPSLTACKQLTGGTGFNEPMQIAPQSNTNGAHCRVLTCLGDGCDDAYQFPKDDTKTHNCPDSTDFVVTFCPGGPGTSTPARTAAPAPAVTTAAPPATPPPTTQAPTPDPTPAPTPIPAAAPVATAAANATTPALAGEIGGEADSRSVAGEAVAEVAAESQAPVEVTTTTPATSEPAAASDAASTPTEPPATEASTQSASGGSATLSVFVVVALAMAVAAAAAVIVVVRRKKRELDAQTEKSPILNPGLATL